VDVVVGDGDDAGVRGDRDLGLGGPDELTGEGPVPLARVAGADPRTTSQEPGKWSGFVSGRWRPGEETSSA